MVLLSNLLNKNKIPYFLCIGTTKSMYDSIGAHIGDRLTQEKYKVLGTSENPLDGVTIPDLYENVISKIDTSIYQLICIDASYGVSNAPYTVTADPIKPGMALGKKLQTIGDISIHVNLGYFIEDFNITHVLFEIGTVSKETMYKMVETVCSMIFSSLASYNDKEEKYMMCGVRYADLIINQNMTVRQIAALSYVSKSTVSRYVSKLLRNYNHILYQRALAVMEHRYKTKYLKGGEATKKKYAQINTQIA